jgi:hypothetical protein
MTHTRTHTPSPTITDTPLFTYTHTRTPTPTNTPSGNRLVVNHTFTGATVNATTNLWFIAFSADEDGPGHAAFTSSAAGTVTIAGIDPAHPNVSLVGLYNAQGQPVSTANDTDPLPGDSIGIYNGACEFSGATTIATGPTPVTVTMSFTRTGCRLYGFSGILNYTGSGMQPGNNCRMYVQLSSTTNFTSPASNRGYEGPFPMSYSLFNDSQLSSSGSYYVRVFFDKNCNAWAMNDQPDPGDPCTILGPLVSGLTPGTLNLALNGTENSCGLPTPTATQTYAHYLYGTADYTSGTVDGYHPIVLRLHDNTNMNNMPVATAVVFSNNGPYVLPVGSSVAGYGLSMEYKLGGSGCLDCWYEVGGALRYYDTGVSLPASSVNISGPTNLNVAMDDTHRIYGYKGRLTYTGPALAFGCDSGDPHLGLAAYNPSQPTVNMASSGACDNGGTYQLGMPSGTWNLRAFIDFNGNWSLDVGEVYEELGSFTANLGSPEFDFTFAGNCVWGPGCVAFTPTATPSSPTPTPTWTRTPTSTFTPTATATSAYRVTGTVNYTGGSYTISPSTPLILFVSPDFDGGVMSPVESNNSAFSVGVPSTGTYLLAAWVGPLVGDGNPMVGRPYIVYNGTCDLGSPTSITVSSPGDTSVGAISFGNSCIFTGVYGNVNYTGIGSVSAASPLRVLSFSDSGYTTEDDWEATIEVNNSRYDLMIMGGSGTHYLRAYLDANRNWSLDPCEPFVNVGPYTAGGVVNQDITFGDTNRYNCTNYVTGTVNFTGGTVDASHPILIQTQPYSGGGGNHSSTSVASSGVSYLVGAVSGSNTVLMVYKAGGISTNCSSCVGTGDYYEVYNDSSMYPGTAVNCSPSAVANLNFNTSWRFGGFVGTVTYTGAGTVDCDGGSPLGVATTNQAVPPVDSVVNWTTVCDSGSSYSLADWSHMPGGGHSYYLVAYYDTNKNHQFDAGDKYDLFGPYTTDYGETPRNLTFSGTYTR